MLNRGLIEAGENGMAIRVFQGATLTICDSLGGGRITGGYSSGDGGGVYNEGTLSISGGALTGNAASGDGGGVWSSGVLNMSGGSLTGNVARSGHGGGIYNQGELNLTGGSVTGNEAKAGPSGGGRGGGILQNGTMSVSDSPFVGGNAADKGDNLFLCSAHSVMNITGALSAGVALGVTPEDGDAVITSGYGEHNTGLPTQFFTPDAPDCRVILENGEVRLTAAAGFTVTFDSNGGSPVDSQVVPNGGKAVRPKQEEEPYHNGYVFAGWYLMDSDGSTAEEEYDFDTPVHADITLKAGWIPVWVVIFDSDNGEETKTFLVHDGDTIGRPAKAPEREGSQFGGWFAVGEDGSLGEKPFDFDVPVTADMILRAKWLFIVAFDGNGSAEEVPAQTVAKGEKASEPDPPPKKKGFVFSGWTAEDPETHLPARYDFGTPVMNNITLTALWEKQEPGSFVVTFDCRYDDGATFIQVVPAGGKATRPDDPTWPGHRFLGWYLSTDGAISYDFDTAVTGDITLAARWEEIRTYTFYTVVFDSDGGSKIGPQSVREGEKAARPDAPVRSGYLFAGWRLNGSLFDFGTVITGDITLKVRWVDPEKAATLPSGLASVKDGAFAGMESAQAIRLPGNLTDFPKGAFDEETPSLAPTGSPAEQRARELGLLVIEE